MGLKDSWFNFRFLEELLGVTVVLCAVDLFIAMFLHTAYGNVLFMEGILLFAAGVYAAAGVSNARSRARERLSTLMTRPEGFKQFLEEQRAAQLAEGIWMMVVGAMIAVIAVVTFLV
jgi:hypothetical protein